MIEVDDTPINGSKAYSMSVHLIFGSLRKDSDGSDGFTLPRGDEKEDRTQHESEVWMTSKRALQTQTAL